MAAPAPPQAVGGAGLSGMTTTLNMRPHLQNNGMPSPTPPPQQTSAKKWASPMPGPPPMHADKIGIPLSARHAEPLDLNTVERRGHPTQVPDFHKPSRPHGLQEAPTYRPTEEEFKNPMEYIRKIAPQAKDFGICKIIPPDGWNPDFTVDTQVRGFTYCNAPQPILYFI